MPGSNHFILEAFDRDLWCAVLQALVHVTDLDALRTLLGLSADDNPELRDGYRLGDEELAKLVAIFGIAFDPGNCNQGICR